MIDASRHSLFSWSMFSQRAKCLVSPMIILLTRAALPIFALRWTLPRYSLTVARKGRKHVSKAASFNQRLRFPFALGRCLPLYLRALRKKLEDYKRSSPQRKRISLAMRAVIPAELADVDHSQPSGAKTTRLVTTAIQVQSSNYMYVYVYLLMCVQYIYMCILHAYLFM